MNEPYSSSGGVAQALKEAAKRAHAADSTVSVQERLRQEDFRRFLSRIFASPNSDWILKGGTGVLARVPDARSTLDIDLYRSGYSLEQSLAELRRLSEVDLGDHFQFVYSSHELILAGDQQAYTEGMRVTFAVYLGVKPRDHIKIDLATGAGITDEITVQHPAGALDLPRLRSAPYRLYPVVDQIADKICATLATYSTGASTREKDLIDLVVFAATQEIYSDSLLRAVRRESARRKLPEIVALVVPQSWGPAYSRMARATSACAEFTTIVTAMELMNRFLDPLLRGEIDDSLWNPSNRSWSAVSH